MSTAQSQLDKIEELADREFGGGFFYELRKGSFDLKDADRVLESLRAILAGDATDAERLAVAARIWRWPLLACWWKDRCISNGADASACELFILTLTDVIGRYLPEKRD